jgi:hypothetical protein
MQKMVGIGVMAALLCALVAFEQVGNVQAAGGPLQGDGGPYRVLAPIASGNLLLFPVVRTEGKAAAETPFLTLDEGFKNGEVEVTEAGRAAGLVRSRGDGQVNRYRGDEVNTLVLVNHSKRPLLLLAGEIVTGGKQDRIIAKDRIVPPDADPIDLSVFCIEPGRWTGTTASFGASANMPAKSFMVQPEVREKAMATQNQQQVWDSVHGAISQMETVTVAASPVAGPETLSEMPRTLGTSSYAKAMQNVAVSEKVDEAAAPVIQGREQVLSELREEHAVGVVVAVHGEIIWADLFANIDLLARYWTKLVRSYAAESLAAGEDHAAPSIADAQHFLDTPVGGRETSEGDVGIYRYRELKSDGAETFVLESLLPGTGYDVHISKMKLRGGERRVAQPLQYIAPQIYH